MRQFVVSLALIAMLVPLAGAESLADVTIPDQVTVGDATLHLNGMGLRKKLWIKVYVGGLYVAETSSDAATLTAAPGPKKMVMHFLTNKATKSKMDSAWDEGFEANNKSSYEVLRARVEQFKKFFGDMKDGDVVEMTIDPAAGTAVAINGTTKGTIDGDDFATALLKVWLGDTPPSEDFKQGLLGQ